MIFRRWFIIFCAVFPVAGGLGRFCSGERHLFVLVIVSEESLNSFIHWFWPRDLPYRYIEPALVYHWLKTHPHPINELESPCHDDWFRNHGNTNDNISGWYPTRTQNIQIQEKLQLLAFDHTEVIPCYWKISTKNSQGVWEQSEITPCCLFFVDNRNWFYLNRILYGLFLHM